MLPRLATPPAQLDRQRADSGSPCARAGTGSYTRLRTCRSPHRRGTILPPGARRAQKAGARPAAAKGAARGTASGAAHSQGREKCFGSFHRPPLPMEPGATMAIRNLPGCQACRRAPAASGARPAPPLLPAGATTPTLRQQRFGFSQARGPRPPPPAAARRQRRRGARGGRRDRRSEARPARRKAPAGRRAWHRGRRGQRAGPPP